MMRRRQEKVRGSYSYIDVNLAARSDGWTGGWALFQLVQFQLKKRLDSTHPIVSTQSS